MLLIVVCLCVVAADLRKVDHDIHALARAVKTSDLEPAVKSEELSDLKEMEQQLMQLQKHLYVINAGIIQKINVSLPDMLTLCIQELTWSMARKYGCHELTQVILICRFQFLI